MVHFKISAALFLLIIDLFIMHDDCTLKLLK